MKEDCFITHERMIVPEIPSSKEEAVIPCMKCTFEDLTPEQIEQIQKPALDAAEVANSAAEAANTAAEAANDATQSANIAAEAANDAATEANNSATLANAAANKANQAAESIDDKISGKQDRLISGDNIEIKDNVISAQGINGKLFEDTSKTYQLYYFKNGLFFYCNKDSRLACWNEQTGEDTVYDEITLNIHPFQYIRNSCFVYKDGKIIVPDSSAITCCDVQAAIQQVAGQVGFSAERVINAVNMGDCNVIQAIQNCCCQTQRQIADFRGDLFLQNCKDTAELRNGQRDLGQAITQGFSQTAFQAQQDKCDIIRAGQDNTH